MVQEPRRRFKFLKEISEGSFGKVYLSEMVTGDRFSSIVAIKLLRGKWLGHEEIVMRSRDEARLLGLLRHRHIIRVEDLTSINGQCAVIMEYLQGVDLKTFTSVLKDEQVQFPRRAIFETTAAIASALNAAYNHEPLQSGKPLRVIHRDIKPSNVMVSESGEVKVLDFGTARANFDEREAVTQALAFGSQAYMAPERLAGDPDTASADVFSLGIVLYELLTLERFGRIYGRRERFQEALDTRLGSLDLTELDSQLADDLRNTMYAMLAFDVKDRPEARLVMETMEELAERATGMGLRRFCRAYVPRARSLREPEQDPTDPLTGSTIFEDSSNSFHGVDSRHGEAFSLAASHTYYDDDEDDDFGGVETGAVQTGSSSPLHVSGSSMTLGLQQDQQPDGAPASASGPTLGHCDPHVSPSGDAEPEPPESAPEQPGSGPGSGSDSFQASEQPAAPPVVPVPASTEEPEEPSQSPSPAPAVVLLAGESLSPGEYPKPVEPAPRLQPPEDEPRSPDDGLPTEPAGAEAPHARKPPDKHDKLGEHEQNGKAVPSPPAVVTALPTSPSLPADAALDSSRPAAGRPRLLLAMVLLAVPVLLLAVWGLSSRILSGVSSEEAATVAQDAPVVQDRPVNSDRRLAPADEPGDVPPLPTSDEAGGDLILHLQPPGAAAVTIISNLGGLQRWDGNDALRLSRLAEGLYRTKISPEAGTSRRATLEVVAGKTCEYTFNLRDGTGEWQRNSCF